MATGHERGHADQHDHDHDDHEHDHGDHDHGDHAHAGGLRGRLHGLFSTHSHDPGDQVDTALEASSEGMRALRISVAGLGATAVLQLLVVLASHSVALLGDTLHNFADALTAVPLAVAFTIGRRPPNRRYTYGYGRGEDLAGVAIVVTIAASSALAAYESVLRLLHPHHVSHLPAVMAASIIGFVGNEVVAAYRIRVGRRIGSAALVADGLHARTDGMTSLAVLVGAAGVALGWKAADPVVGLVITVAILFVLRNAARDVYRRLMDAVDPELVDRVEAVLRATPGVVGVGEVRLRWIGHALRAEVRIVVDGSVTVAAGHDIAEECHHRLLHQVPRLTEAIVHADPSATDHDPHDGTAHHGGR